MTVRIYRLVVQYPEGSHDSEGWPVDSWEPPDWRPVDLIEEPDTGAWITPPFKWPSVRCYLSRTGAEGRAKLLRRYGAVVEVQRSEPVVWS